MACFRRRLPPHSFPCSRSQARAWPCHNRFAQRHDSAGGRVLGAILFDGLDGGLLDGSGRGEVGFPGAKIGDVHALWL